MVFRRFISVCLGAIFLLSFALGCKDNNDKDLNSDSGISDISNISDIEYTYVPEIVFFPDLPHGFSNINNIVFFDDLIYFTAEVNSVGDYNSWIHSHRVFSMHINGTDLKELPDYTMKAPLETTRGNVSLDTLIIDTDGYLWVIETVIVSWPDMNRFVRKLSSTGAELLSIDVSAHFTREPYSYSWKFNVDSESNIYIASEDRISVLDITGRLLFSLDSREEIDRIIRLLDSTIALQDGRGILRKIDAGNKTWGELIDLPGGTNTVLDGSGEFLVLFLIGLDLRGVCMKTGDNVEVLDFIDSDILFDDLLNIALLPDGRIIIATYTLTGGLMDPPITEFIILTKAPYFADQEKAQLTLAGFEIDEYVRNAVVYFNRASTTYRIQMTDYAVFNTSTDDSAGLTRLSTEIIAGRVPDILDLSNLPFRQYAAKGLLADLNTFLDNDSEIDRANLFESVLRAAHTDGALFRLFPAFDVSTIIGNPEVLGNSPGWSVGEFKDILYANPNAVIPMGEWMTKERFLNQVFTHNIDQFVDWDSGEVHFDKEGFIEILELSDMFALKSNQDIRLSLLTRQFDSITAGHQIMEWLDLDGFLTYRMNRSVFGGEIIFKGFPGESRKSGMFIVPGGVAITEVSENKQGAWEFVRVLLSEDFGRENIHRNFPVNRVLFEEQLANAMVDNYPISMSDPVTRQSWEISELSVEEAERIVDLINSISCVAEHDDVLWNIISESASDYFNRQKTAQDAARIIQSRALIYMSEMSG